MQLVKTFSSLFYLALIAMASAQSNQPIIPPAALASLSGQGLGKK